jgi:sialate O-acetylesterase
MTCDEALILTTETSTCMQLGVAATFSGRNASRHAHERSHIRLFTAGLHIATAPLAELGGLLQPWSVPSAATIDTESFGVFSATCWYFGDALYSKQGVPLGLVVSSWGGTSVEAWSPAEALDACGMPHQPHPPPDQRNSPSGLYNGMIAPLTTLSIFGAVFYQGEHDSLPVNNSLKYSCTFPKMIASWRERWHRASQQSTPALFPFGFVQLSDVNCASNQTCGDGARYVCSILFNYYYNQTCGDYN